jgi:hypothetical protein
MRTLSIALAVITLSACGSSPAAPAPTITGTLGATIDRDCSGPRFGVTSVTVSVDGVAIGTAVPGGQATRVLPVGPHVITGRAQNGITWGGDTHVTTAASPDRVQLFACI